MGMSLTQIALEPMLLLNMRRSSVCGAPYFSHSCGAMTFPTDLEILEPVLSMKCSYLVWKGGGSVKTSSIIRSFALTDSMRSFPYPSYLILRADHLAANS